MEDTENQSIHTARHHASFGKGKRQYGMWHDFMNDIIMRNDVYAQWINVYKLTKKHTLFPATLELVITRA